MTTDPAVAAGALARGALVAFPTETVYGLGADAEDGDAVARIFRAKGRPAGHPLIVHGHDAGVMDRYASAVPASARLLADAVWPGPLTLVLPRSGRVPDAVTGGRPTVGLRVPAHPAALAMLAALGRGVAAPSANPFGRTSPTTAGHVLRDLGDRVDLVLDGGPCGVGVESTIVDLSGDRPEVLRPGGVPRARIEEILGRAVDVVTAGPARAPGMLAVHYAPRARVVLAPADSATEVARGLLAAGRDVGILAERGTVGTPPGVTALTPSAGGADGLARDLYALLRRADALGLSAVVAVAPDGDGLAAAVRDRLGRAAAAGA